MQCRGPDRTGILVFSDSARPQRVWALSVQIQLCQSCRRHLGHNPRVGEIESAWKFPGVLNEHYSFCMHEQTSTHLDAPCHLAEGKWSLHEIPLNHLMGPGVVIDMRDKVAGDANAELSTDDFMTWLEEHGPLPDGVIIFIRTGWSSKYENIEEYFGTEATNTSYFNFPGLSVGAAQLIVSHEAATGRRVFAVGTDAPSIDHGPSEDFKAQQTLFEANIYGIESVANLDKLPTKGFGIIAMPVKIRGGCGAPVRLLASLPEANGISSSTAATFGSQILLALTLVILNGS
ncbi:isatin hydrolase-like isoform X2 [Macrobrachium rosenbergii]|uniref:isatin hydrolase-like isoform X2 n=1 Tax=Macrobrachium rosenbergii TaxID=79674 RepID=UPI0034D69188